MTLEFTTDSHREQSFSLLTQKYRLHLSHLVLVVLLISKLKSSTCDCLQNVTVDICKISSNSLG